MSEAKFKPVLGLWDATMVVAGSMIGSGIFIVSADIVRNVGSPGWLIAVWLITGFMTIIAAVSYGELSGMFPKAGGQYVYLKEAYNPLVAFLYGWSFFAVIQTATIAAVGVAFARFSAYIFPWMSETNKLINLGFTEISAAQVSSIILIIFLTYVNTRGIKEGKIIQTSFTVSKLIALFGLILFGFLLVKESSWDANWQSGFNAAQDFGTDANGKEPSGWKEIGGITLLGAIAAAMTGSLFSSDAWNNVTFIAGEIKNPKRNIGLSLFLGTLMVTILYITTNLMYLKVLPLDGIAFPQEDRLAISAANQIFGEGGKYVIAVLIMVSTFGCNNGLILAGARVYYTMAKDNLFFKKAGELNKNAVPEWALWAQCVVASILCLSGGYGNLLDMISLVVVIFYTLTIAGIFILRKKRPDAERPYKAFGYPVLPFIYILMGIAFCTLLIIYKPDFTWPGLIITLIGIPLYYLAIQRNKASAK
ncbi:amino acid permease [Chryseolinea sp. H1M3-3]|uniref:APC family permease n=1 Tax=Chryseolinea sp. H1M3-3 TaxID=3034144 RepID=UPI0023EBBAFE|nr:amino acid permease [Chryseolinea sp. H1M3-3]